MSPKKKAKTIVGIAWYRPEQWLALKEFCEDSDVMDPTYETWKDGAQKVIRELRSTAQEVEPVDFDLEKFKIWCTVNKKRPIAASRSEFASFKLRETHET